MSLLKDSLKKVVEAIPLLILGGAIWLGATAYQEHKSHKLVEEQLQQLVQALVESIRANQQPQQVGGGGQDGQVESPTEEQ